VTTNEELIGRLKDVLEDALSGELPNSKGIPDEAMPLGTVSRAVNHGRLGVIVDAFYGDLDKDNQKIIVYTILLLPETSSLISKNSKLSSDQYYLTNEYEYNVIGYLMIPPVNLDLFSHIIG
tara:strand:- start:2791 stop:3156 length:366 start_codon:yes stop_codon:yes gene_type:complete